MPASAASLAVSPPVITASPAELATTAYIVPGALQQFLQNLEDWALESDRKAIWDRFKFWSLKAAAILVSASAGVVALIHHELGLPVAILNGIVVICVLLDGMLRPGKRRNAHLRVSDGLRNLKDDLAGRWHLACFEGRTSSTTLAEILEDGWTEWKRINRKSR